MTQDEAFRVLTIGKNVFLTGAAGSGKTFVLNRYIAWLRARGVDPAVTASTGIAATHIGGQTIHSWSGIGVKDYLGPYELDRIEQNERLVKRFRSTRVLIIDEVSMLSATTLGLVDQAIRAGLQSTEPFGGMQVVLCGDFFQLPPVVRGGEALFAFQGEVWHTLDLHMCYLSEQYRHADGDLLQLLNAIREGAVQQKERAILEARIGLQAPEQIPHLYTHNVDVDRLNNERLAALEGYPHTYEMQTKGSKKNVEILKRGMLVPEVLQLKKDAVVMFVKNHPQGKYVNGTLGTVVDMTSFGSPIVRTHDGRTLEVEAESWRMEDGDRVKAELIQLPLRLAWAVTVHKSQGMTLDAGRMDLSKTFVPGQGYVALSRVRSLTGLYVDGVCELAYSRHPAVAEADEVLRRRSASLTRRLAQTSAERFVELQQQFVTRIGGSEPVPGKKRAPSAHKENTRERTLRMLHDRLSFEDIAEQRGLTPGTILGHVEWLLQEGRLSPDELAHAVSVDEEVEPMLAEIKEAFREEEDWKLQPAYQRLGGKYEHSTLRIARLFLKKWRA